MDPEKARRIRKLIADTKQVTGHGAGICRRAGLENLAAALEDLYRRWKAEERPAGGGRPCDLESGRYVGPTQ